MWLPPIFFWFPTALGKICFSRIVINRTVLVGTVPNNPSETTLFICTSYFCLFVYHGLSQLRTLTLKFYLCVPFLKRSIYHQVRCPQCPPSTMKQYQIRLGLKHITKIWWHGFESHRGQSFFFFTLIVWSIHISLLKGNAQFEIKKFPSSSVQDELISLELVLESIQAKVHVLKCDVTNMWEFFTMFFQSISADPIF